MTNQPDRGVKLPRDSLQGIMSDIGFATLIGLLIIGYWMAWLIVICFMTSGWIALWRALPLLMDTLLRVFAFMWMLLLILITPDNWTDVVGLVATSAMGLPAMLLAIRTLFERVERAPRGPTAAPPTPKDERPVISINNLNVTINCPEKPARKRSRRPKPRVHTTRKRKVTV